MIKIENIQVNGFEAAIRGMRNPMNSWDKSDSEYLILQTGKENYLSEENVYIVGDNDLDLMSRLASAGQPSHRKYLRMIDVTMDITAPLYLWKEIDQYKVGTVTNSTSTMHKIHAKEFTLDDFSHERMSSDGVELLQKVIGTLNEDRKWFNTAGIDNQKDYWYEMIQLLPSSYNQLRTFHCNYEVLANMYFDRKYHKLSEWREFCEIIETLPYFKSIFKIKK